MAQHDASIFCSECHRDFLPFLFPPCRIRREAPWRISGCSTNWGYVLCRFHGSFFSTSCIGTGTGFLRGVLYASP